MEFIESERGNQKLNMKLIKFVGGNFPGGGGGGGGGYCPAPSFTIKKIFRLIFLVDSDKSNKFSNLNYSSYIAQVNFFSFLFLLQINN